MSKERWYMSKRGGTCPKGEAADPIVSLYALLTSGDAPSHLQHTSHPSLSAQKCPPLPINTPFLQCFGTLEHLLVIAMNRILLTFLATTWKHMTTYSIGAVLSHYVAEIAQRTWLWINFVS